MKSEKYYKKKNDKIIAKTGLTSGDIHQIIKNSGVKSQYGLNCELEELLKEGGIQIR